MSEGPGNAGVEGFQYWQVDDQKELGFARQWTVLNPDKVAIATKLASISAAFS